MSGAIYQNPTTLLQQLIRFDTTNPPGNEGPCIQYIAGLLQEAGIESTILARNPARPNLIARLPGRGDASPLLLYGHVDVVTTANQQWTHPPFSGDLIDGVIWGRGALDMKGGIAMLVAAFLRAKAEGLQPAGDLILAILSDEESGGRYGAQFLAQEHAEQFSGVRYAIGEFGGFPLHVGGKQFYTIGVAEKQVCTIRATFRGPGGHGSRPIRGGAMAQLGAFLQIMDQNRLPVHLTPVVRQMIETLGEHLPDPAGSLIRRLLEPATLETTLEMLGPQGVLFPPLLSNTASPTIVSGGHAVNVIPSEVTLQLDGRMLPGFTPDEFIAEIRSLVGDGPELEVVTYDPGPPPPDMTLFDDLVEVLREAEPEAIGMPLMLTGATDGRHLAQIGIQTYGFLPMNLPPNFSFMQTLHAADERIPAGAVAFGTDCIYRFLQRRW